jgi:hypothetical protein
MSTGCHVDEGSEVALALLVDMLVEACELVDTSSCVAPVVGQVAPPCCRGSSGITSTAFLLAYELRRHACSSPVKQTNLAANQVKPSTLAQTFTFSPEGLS